MGAIFQLEHINFIAYLISKETKTPALRKSAPRSDVQTLRSFLELFASQRAGDRNTISSDRNWQDNLRNAAQNALQQLPSWEQPSTQILYSSDVANALDPLAPFFTGYKLYALIAPPYQTIETSEAVQTRASAFQHLATASDDVLVLMPIKGGAFVNVIDPFPALKELAWSPVAPPAVVFWTRNGTSLALNLRDATAFFNESLAPSLPNDTVETIDAKLATRANERDILRVLHISDVHFGHEQADARRTYLEQHLAGVIKSVDRVVLTGDLFHSPSAKLKAQFEEFRRNLEN